MLILFNKPYQVLSQFNPNPDYPSHKTLEDTPLPDSVSAFGRLDYDSEGLLLLGDSPSLERKLFHPDKQITKTYLAQVDGTPTKEDIDLLNKGGLEIRVGKKIHSCLPAKAQLTTAPEWLWERTPAVDQHAEARSSWVQIQIKEGKNRQVRKMTAKLGYPTLRLIRTKVGVYSLNELCPGEFRKLK